jgi:hypothetical protein
MQEVYIRINLFPTNYTSFGMHVHYYPSDMFQLIKIPILRESVYTKVHLMLQYIVIHCAW